MSYMAGACTGHLVNIIFGWRNNVMGKAYCSNNSFF